jgi:hypothetical protein
MRQLFKMLLYHKLIEPGCFFCEAPRPIRPCQDTLWLPLPRGEQRLLFKELRFDFKWTPLGLSKEIEKGSKIRYLSNIFGVLNPLSPSQRIRKRLHLFRVTIRDFCEKYFHSRVWTKLSTWIKTA